MARSAVCLSCCAHRNILKQSCLVHGDSSGAGGSSCSGHGGHAPLSPKWKRSLRAPDSSSCPEEASASKPAQEGFWFLWDVLSCLSGPGVLSCHVLFCVSSPGGLLIPPDFPREIFGGGGRRGSGCRGRAEGTEAKAPEDHLPWPLELPTPPWPPELPTPPWPPELPALPWHPELPAPPWPPERPPPLPGGTVTAWDTPSGRGELCQGYVVCVMCSCLLCLYLVCFLSLFHVIMS